MKYTFYLFVFILLFPRIKASAQENLQLPNPGFEEELSGWSVSEAHDRGMSRVTEEAARNGQGGLQIEDRDTAFGSSAFSSYLPASAGRRYQMRFWARNREGTGVGVYLVFYDAKRQPLNRVELKNENFLKIPDGTSDWKLFRLEGDAPEGTERLRIWIHSAKATTGVSDIDDFTVVELEN